MKTKAQTSMEFIFVLVAVAGAAVVAFGMLHSMQASQESAFNSIANGAAGNYVSYGGGYGSAIPYLYAEMANITYINSSNEGYIVAYVPSGYVLNGISIEGHNTSVVWQNQSSMLQPSGIYTTHFFVVPKGQGYVSASVHATFSGPSAPYYANSTVYSFAEPAPVQIYGKMPIPGNGIYLVPYIQRHNETMVYGLSSVSPVGTVSMTNHCTYENWEYQVAPLPVQCGNAQWDFNIFSDYCYWDRGIMTATYCVYMNPTGTYAGTFNSTPSYKYNITLELSNSTYGAALEANLSNANATANVVQNGKSYGVAAVGNYISGDSSMQQSSVPFLETGNASKEAGSKAYQAYVQALNNMYSVLGYYNGSGVDGDTLSTIQEAINAYNSGASSLLNSSAQQGGGCWLGNDPTAFICDPTGPFAYANITVRISNGISAQQGTEYFEGSAINVKG
jgi:hypothetical protein